MTEDFIFWVVHVELLHKLKCSSRPRFSVRKKVLRIEVLKTWKSYSRGHDDGYSLDYIIENGGSTRDPSHRAMVCTNHSPPTKKGSEARAEGLN
jgi:hypothetical protein